MPAGAAEAAGRSTPGVGSAAHSAVTRDWHVGKPAHPLMIQAAAGFGYDLSKRRGVLLDRELLD
ncbi:hypothetical protein VM98_38975, partial [Streptomyces rubellomurinus subsp. indigoferus]